MKRLIALIGAVATAFGLYAADSFSISFEGAESAKGVDASAMTFTPPSPDWKWDGDTLNIKAYGDGKMLPYGTGALARRDSSFVGEGDNDNYLTLETGTNALTRAVGGNVFLDQLVKFTGFEEYQTNVVAGTKIAVWMSGIEQEGTPAVPGNGEPEFIDDLDNPLEEGGYGQKPNPEYFAGTPASDDYIAGETNLYITVGKADIMGKAEPIALKIDGTFKLDTWYRLTIKSIGNVFGESREVAPRAGFIVYIDGVQAKSLDSEAKTLIATVNEMTSEAQGFMADGALFPAIDTTDATFATVGYQGIGAIDDIILDDQGPAFAQAIDVEITFPVDAEGNPSVEVDYIDVGGVHMTYPCAVLAGTLITVYFKAVDGKKIMSNLQPQQLTVTASTSTINISAVVVEDVVAKKNRTEDLAESELYTVLGALVENDTVETISTCNVTNGEAEILYSFTPNTTITATAAGWDVFVGNYDMDDGEGGTIPAPGMLTVSDDITANFTMNVGVEDEAQSWVIFSGTAINGQLAITNGLAMTGAAVTVGDGALLKAATFTPGDAITLVGTGKFVTQTDLASAGMGGMIVDGDGNVVVPTVNDPEEGWYTYALAIEPTPTPTTGFAIIIADAEAGTSTTNYYESLDAAIAAAGTTVGDVTLPSVVTILENVTIENTVLISKAVTLDATGKTVTCAAMYPFFVKGGDLTITDGTFTQNVVDGIILWAKDGGKITVNGGDFSAIPDGEIAYVSTADALIKIYGGKFVMANKADGSKGDVLNVAQTLGLNKTDYIQVYGGSFSKDPAEGDDALGPTFVADGYCSFVKDGLYEVALAVAKIGTKSYPTLAAAFAAAQNDDTIKVIADCTVADAILVDKAVTLDATGKTVTCAAMYPFFVKGGDLTITDGTFTQNVVDGIILWAKDGGKITVNGGDFSAIPDGEIAYVSTADALIKIYGGKFVMANKADGSKGDVLNVAQTLGLNKTDYIQVYGGSFSKDPAEGDDALGPTFVADGYASVKQDNGLWKVGAAIIATFKVDDAIVKAETNIVAFTPVAPTNPSKEGYTFTGWTPAVDEISKSTVFVAQFKAEETKVDPEQPIPVPAEKTPEQVAEQMNTKGIANYLKVPTVVTDAAAYTAMFAAKADGNTVIIALKPTVEAEIKAELANTATSGSMLNPDATTSEVTITARPGLFYGIKAVGDVTTIGTANGQNWVQASGDTVNVVRPTVSGNAAFFQAVCSPKAPPANN